MAQCSTIINGQFQIDHNPPNDISNCQVVMVDGAQYAQLNNLLFQANNPIDYTQSATAFSVVFTTTMIYWITVFKGVQILKVVGLLKRT